MPLPAPRTRRRATINDVAVAAEVSRQTVSNVINFPQRVRAETRDRVLAQIDRLGYRPSSAAKSMRSQRAGAIGYELNAVSGSGDIGHLVLTAMTVQAPTYGVHLVPFAHPTEFPAVGSYRDMTRRNLVDAFIFADTHTGDPRPDWLLEAGIPFATFGRMYSHPELTNWVDVDGHLGLAAAVRHLVEQGYRRVGYLGWPLHHDDVAVTERRHQGWAETSQALGVRGPEGVAVQQLDAAVEAATALLDQLEPGDAIACASDLLALGVMYAAAARGWRVGPDLGVVGFDGSVMAQRHGMTTVVQPFEALADRLLTLAQVQLTGGATEPVGQLLTPTLQVRSSTDRTATGTAYSPLPVLGNRR